MRVVMFLAVLPVLAWGAAVPQLPPSGFADTEASTNLTVSLARSNVDGLSLSLAFDGTASNNVEVVLGRDADGDGILSFDEMKLRLGWDCGRYFIERMDTGERLEQTGVCANGVRRTLDCEWKTRRGTLKSLSVVTEGGPAFPSLSEGLPTWLYSEDWDKIRLTVRGTDVPDERLSYVVTERGVIFILR